MSFEKIIITGATGTIGEAVAKKIASPGESFVLHYNTSKQKALRLKKDLKRLGTKCFVIEADLSKVSKISSFVKRAEKLLGGIDLFIHTAAIFERTPFNRVTEKEWDKILNINLKATFFLAQKISIAMRDGGAMIFFSDVAAKKPYVGYLPYSIAKAGIDNMTMGLAKLFAPKIRVNAIAPYLVSRHKTPLGRATNPKEIAAIVETILKSETMTGQIIAVDRSRLFG